jgi:hypothetical protein
MAQTPPLPLAVPLTLPLALGLPLAVDLARCSTSRLGLRYLEDGINFAAQIRDRER